jgi:formate-dependent nitrite reductase membrane component NrfD
MRNVIERAPYGRQKHRASRLNVSAYQGETYYDQPPIKPTHYGWVIVTYLFIGGLAGGAQWIATLADWVGDSDDQAVVRAGRYIALLGALASPALLIADLHKPERWYNMLRIARLKTSAMSLGAWTLSAFGVLSGISAVAQALSDLTRLSLFRWTARIAGVPAALAGGLMAVYTGSLLAATSIPAWAASFRLLPPHFGALATATAASALSLIERLRGHSSSAARLDRVALSAGGVDLALSVAIESAIERRAAGEAPLSFLTSTAGRWGVLGLGVLVPLLLRLAGLRDERRSRSTSILAALATLAGGYLMRAVLVFAGNQSARRPREYFWFTRPGERRPAAGGRTEGRRQWTPR